MTRVGALEVGPLSLGSWHTYDRMDFADAVALLRAAIDGGVTLFDVGVYGFPGAPPVFTDVLFSAMVRAAGLRRDQWQLSSKLWLEGFGEQGFRPQLENALFRVGADHADLVVLGDLRRDDLALRDLVLDLASLREAGLILEWGVNNWSAANIAELSRIATEEGVAGPVIAQLKYSVARRAIPDGEPFGRLFDDGLVMQASDVMEGGALVKAGQLAREIGRDPGGIRDAIVGSQPRLAELAERLGTTAGQLCVAFTLTHRANATTLFGATRLEQLEQALRAPALVARIGADELRELVTPFWADRDLVDPAGP